MNNGRAERMCMPTRQDLLDGWIYMGLLSVFFLDVLRAGKSLNSLDGS